jgi:hypothetical protein
MWWITVQGIFSRVFCSPFSCPQGISYRTNLCLFYFPFLVSVLLPLSDWSAVQFYRVTLSYSRQTFPQTGETEQRLFHSCFWGRSQNTSSCLYHCERVRKHGSPVWITRTLTVRYFLKFCLATSFALISFLRQRYTYDAQHCNSYMQTVLLNARRGEMPGMKPVCLSL